MIHILNTRPGQIRRIGVKHLIRMDRDGRLLRFGIGLKNNYYGNQLPALKAGFIFVPLCNFLRR